MDPKLGNLRRSYSGSPLRRAELAPDWLAQFRRWLDAALLHETVAEPNAMVLATVSAAAAPSTRTVLLKAVDERGLVFFTHYTSRKGRDIAQRPAVSLLFLWQSLARQVIVSGDAVPVSAAESDEYFASRPYGSQVGAWASVQSQLLSSRAELEQATTSMRKRFPAGSLVPRPPHWGGIRVTPKTVEFWQGHTDRLHDRLRYRLQGQAEGTEGKWVIERLAP
ncbi:MAG: pyridoxamine 5'-phosphate oxidase [Acidimicrobiales bacterium]|nr:MAG: pyridoxamine 5'-phosphate oxidase [Acidimicrobiales bacterium]